MFVKTYLGRGAASSADDFTYLLDELNAYSHDLHSAVKLAPLHKGGGQAAHRDGLSALMAFVMRYVGVAQAQHPATWQGLQQPETKQVVQKLWTQAETVLASSCAFPAYGTKDKTYVGFLCNAGNAAPLASLLGRAPAAPGHVCRPARPRCNEGHAPRGSGQRKLALSRCVMLRRKAIRQARRTRGGRSRRGRLPWRAYAAWSYPFGAPLPLKAAA